MKVLFVYRGYGKNLSNSVINAQSDSLIKAGLDIVHFPFTGGGISGYLNSFIKLKKYLKKNHVDIVHSHFSYSGFISSVAFNGPTICSLMGSDVFNQSKMIFTITKLFSNKIWSKTIVKTEKMKKFFQNAVVIPNGVDLKIFKPLNRDEAFYKTGFNPHKKNTIFVANNVNSYAKNYKLAQTAINLLNDNNIVLNEISGVKHSMMKYYYNAADLLLLASKYEGSPNVIKEAMACSCPIVSTDVGDVKEVIGNTEGCYITNYDPEDVTEKIKIALEFGKRTNGRKNIQHLESSVVARKIIDIYRQLLS